MGILLGMKYFKLVAYLGFILIFICALFPGLFGIWFAIMQTLILTVPGIKILRYQGEQK